jgi:hypothetical protein
MLFNFFPTMFSSRDVVPGKRTSLSSSYANQSHWRRKIVKKEVVSCFIAVINEKFTQETENEFLRGREEEEKNFLRRKKLERFLRRTKLARFFCCGVDRNA